MARVFIDPRDDDLVREREDQRLGVISRMACPPGDLREVDSRQAENVETVPGPQMLHDSVWRRIFDEYHTDLVREELAL